MIAASDLELSKADSNDFDGVLLPGGARGKPVMVICHGQWLLVSSRLVKDRTMTSRPMLQDDIRNAGGNWQDEECIRDRNRVGSRKPDDLPAFNKAIVACVPEVQPAKAMRPASRDAVEVRG